MNALHFTTNPEDYYTVQFNALSTDSTCLVVANCYTNKATFLEIKELEPNKFKFQKMGMESEENVKEKRIPGE